MLRAIFIGSKNDFDEILAHWLSQRTELVGVVWSKSANWRRSWKGRFGFAWKRIRRYGLLKAIDETLFYLYYYRLQDARSEEELKRDVVEHYWASQLDREWKADVTTTDNVNSIEVREFVKQRRPDLIFAMCINDYFGRRIRSIPRHGAFLWHEGITPEYKGLYSPFWAVHNLEFEKIGYTLLRMNDKYDAGEVFAQGRATEVDPFRHTHDYMGHKSILDSLPDVERLLADMEAGQAQPIDRSGSSVGSYTYPGISDLIRQRMRLRRLCLATRSKNSRQN